MEETTQDRIDVLDQGFVRLVDAMGGDAAVVQAARVSYGAGTKTVRDDARLIDYLMRHDHTSPFEMVELKLHVKAPLFVARQWLRHRTASVNEVSARYSVVPAEAYLPTPEALRGQGSRNRQVGDGELHPAFRDTGAGAIEQATEYAFASYEALIADGHARELARMVLPLNTYTEWYWKIDLHNLLRFLELRLHPHAQAEIRVYAEAVLAFARRVAPVSVAAWAEHRQGAVRLSRSQVAALGAWLGSRAEEAPVAVREILDKLCSS
jgi:thymidylate synthase (FAD)